MIKAEGLRNRGVIAARLAAATAVVAASLVGWPGRARVGAQGSQDLQFCRNLYDSRLSQAKVVAAGDWDLDHLRDVAVGSYIDRQVAILRHKSRDELYLAEKINIGSQVTDLKTANIDGVGSSEDLGIFSNDYIDLNFPQGTGFNFRTIRYNAPWSYNGIQAGALVDIDRDGVKEVLFADFWRGGPYVLRLKGDKLELDQNANLEKVESPIAAFLRSGPFVLTRDGKILGLTAETKLEMTDIWKMNSGDFNGDGADDAAGLDLESDTLNLWLSPCYNLVRIKDIPLNIAGGLSVGNLDHDSYDDLVIAAGGDSNKVRVIWGGDFSHTDFEVKEKISFDFNIWTTAIADFNGDGRMELAVGNEQIISDDVFLTFEGRIVVKEERKPGVGVISDNALAIDINGDNRPEFIHGRDRTGYREVSVDLNSCGYQLIPSPTATLVRPTPDTTSCPDLSTTEPTATFTPSPRITSTSTPKEYSVYMPFAVRHYIP